MFLPLRCFGSLYKSFKNEKVLVALGLASLVFTALGATSRTKRAQKNAAQCFDKCTDVLHLQPQRNRTEGNSLGISASHGSPKRITVAEWLFSSEGETPGAAKAWGSRDRNSVPSSEV